LGEGIELEPVEFAPEAELSGFGFSALHPLNKSRLIIPKNIPHLIILLLFFFLVIIFSYYF